MRRGVHVGGGALCAASPPRGPGPIVRTAFIRALTDLAAGDDRVTLLVGDLGYSVVEEFAARFPKQYLNVGVAEQNMAGVAAGLALAGRVVFTYSIGNFPTL